MHAGKSYKFPEFLHWTRRSIYGLVVISLIPVILYQVAGLKWLVMPWSVVLLLGTAVALMAGFKNTQTYGRTWEAQQVWSSIQSKSLAWGEMSCGFLGDQEASRKFVYRHLAWLTALRYAMRERRAWETSDSSPNREYKRFYTVPEKEDSLEDELGKYLPCEDVAPILVASSKAARVLALQSKAIKDALDGDLISTSAFAEMQKLVRDLHDSQSKSEMIKDVPYPRQYAIVNTIFVRILCVLLPFAMISEFEKLNELASGFMRGNMVWLAVPLSVLISWMYTSLDQVGESTSNPFEGGANDIPISRICQEIEMELKEMLGETGLPTSRATENEIVM